MYSSHPTFPAAALIQAAISATPATPASPATRASAAALASPASPAYAFPFDPYRRLRFPNGRPRCPHCDHARVHRWGSFRGRRRYRCVACARTFSDFTGTPLAYLKRIDRWPAFCHCMVQSLSVRATGRRLGIDKDTAFRWRHRLLAALDAADSTPLGAPLGGPRGARRGGSLSGSFSGPSGGPTGGPRAGRSRSFVAFGETWFPHSQKGSRRLDRPPRQRAAFRREAVTPVWVFVARDGWGRIASGVVGLRRPRSRDLESALGKRLSRSVTLVCGSGPFGAVGTLAAHLEVSYRRATLRSPELGPVGGYVLGLRRWLRRFRGVATRYLPHYLAWHRFLAAHAS